MNGTLSRGKSSEKKEEELKDPGAGKSGNIQSQSSRRCCWLDQNAIKNRKRKEKDSGGGVDGQGWACGLTT
jgi:hypothetical protein